MKINCEVCGKQFISHREKTRKPSRFCSWICRIKSKDKIVNCKNCNKEFRVPKSKVRLFCSQKCSNVYNQKPNPFKKAVFICQWCGKEFTTWAYRKQIMCSRQCNSEYGASQRAKQLYKGGSSSRGAEWRKIAKSIRERDNYTCAVCNKDNIKSIHVHHIIPIRDFNSVVDANALDNLICLCSSCHPKVECGLIKLSS